MTPKWLPKKEIGRRVREIRDGLGVSQADFAKALARPGSQSEISKLERGVPDTIDKALLVDIAGLAGLPVAHFQVGADTDERAEKLIVARWMRRMADQLVAEATSPDAERKSKADASREAIRKADEAKREADRRRKAE